MRVSEPGIKALFGYKYNSWNRSILHEKKINKHSKGLTRTKRGLVKHVSSKTMPMPCINMDEKHVVVKVI